MRRARLEAIRGESACNVPWGRWKQGRKAVLAVELVVVVEGEVCGGAGV